MSKTKKVINKKVNNKVVKTNIFIKIFGFIRMIFFKICICIYRFIKYVWYGLISPIIFLVTIFSKLALKSREANVEKLKKGSRKLKEKEDKKEKKKEKEGKFKIDTTAYKNENIVFEKKNLGYYINAGIGLIVALPASIKKRIDNIGIVKQLRNKKAFDTKTMLVDFSEEDK